MIKLISLQIKNRGLTGWSSPLLEFGKHITQFRGENHSGKTPIVQSLVYCLGYPISFRKDWIANCYSAELKLEINGSTFFIERKYSSDAQNLDIEVRKDGRNKKFYSESEFSDFFFSNFGLKPISLIDIKGKHAKPYISTVFPIFYLDQDIGYSEIYRPANKFIKDQFLEMIRYLFGFAAKNSFASAGEVERFKAERSALDELIAAAKSAHSRVVEEIDSAPEELLRSQLADLKGQLELLKNSQGGYSESINAITSILNSLNQQKWEIESEIRELNYRIESFERIKMEMLAEGDILLMNSKAKRIFESTINFCGNESCGLFKASEGRFSKNILYLKDQIKDLEHNINSAANIRFIKKIKFKSLQDEIKVIEEKKSLIDSSLPIKGIVQAANEVTKNIIELERQLIYINQSKKSTLKIISLETERNGITSKIDALSNRDRSGEAEVQWLRSELQFATSRWLDILETEGVDRNVEIDSLLNFKFGFEPITTFKGSTRIRAVLAVHAAIFEIYLKKIEIPISFLIFDTPNQQELQQTDLTKFMSALKVLCRNHNAQVIFASKDYKLQAEEEDIVYLPNFPGEKHPMYLSNDSIINNKE